MGVGETGPLGGEDDVARQRQLQRAGVAMAVDGADHRLRQVGQPLDHLGLEEGLRQLLAGGYVGEVVARREAAAGAAHDHQAHRLGLEREAAHVGVELPEQLDVERVQLLGAVQGQRGRAPAVGAKDEAGHASSLLMVGRWPQWVPRRLTK
jgi:hypothetical protein